MSMSKLGIVEPSVKDYPELTDVWEASVRATHHFLREEDIQFFKPLILNEYLKAVRLHCVKDASGEINGFIGTLDNAIEMLFIRPSARGKGIGRALAEFAINNENCIKVDVNEENEQAVGFYKKLGFKTTGRSEKDGFGKPYPLLHMEL